MSKGIKGNEIADDLAKNAIRNCDPGISAVNLDLSLSEIKSIIKRHCIKIWQQQYISNSTGAFYKKMFSLHLQSKSFHSSSNISSSNWPLLAQQSHATNWFT